MYHFTFSSAIFLGSNFFTPLLTLAIICHVDYSSLSGSWVVTHCGCDFYSPKDWWTVGNSERDGNTSHLTCLLRNLYAGQEARVRTGHGTTDWFQIGKGVCQGCILSPCLFNLYSEYTVRNAGLDEAQAGIKIARKNILIFNLRYADDTTLMAESEEELKSLLMKVKGETKKMT